MSADTSDPALAAAAAALHDTTDPASWLVACYAPGTTAIVLRAKGGAPRFPGLRDAMDFAQEIAFAYVLVRGKGLVVLVLNGVGGVKRAKAIVHVRAFASLFPEYLALATLTAAAELTDKLIAERLGLPVDEVVEAAPEDETTLTAPAPESASSQTPSSSTPSASALASTSPPPPPLPSKSPHPPSQEHESSSSSGSTPGPSSHPHSLERDLPDLPDDPTTPRAAVQPASTNVAAPVPQRPRKRSASPPVSSGMEKTTPAPHSRSQPTSPSIPPTAALPSMAAQMHTHPPPIPPTPTTPITPITPVTPKAPVDPSAPRPLYQGNKAVRAEAVSDAEQTDKEDPAGGDVSRAADVAAPATGLLAAAATVLGMGTVTSPVAASPRLSSPHESFGTPPSAAPSSYSDSPRQRSVSNSSARPGSRDSSSTRPLSRDSAGGYWGGRPPSRDASVPTSVTSDSRRSSRRGSDPAISPTMLGRMSMDAPPVPPLPHELRRASREPMRGDPEPLRVASVPHSPMSSPLIHSPHSQRGSSGSKYGHFMPAPLPVPDAPPPAVPAIPYPLPNPAGMPLAPSSAVGSPPIPQRSRQRLPSSHGGRPLPPPSPVPDVPLPPLPNVPPLKASGPTRPPRPNRGLSASAGPSPDPNGGSFTPPPLPPVPAAVREASLAMADSGPNSLLSSPLAASPGTSPRVSTEPASPLSPNSHLGSGSGAWFSARSSMADRRDTRDSSMRELNRHDSDRPTSTLLPYARSETSPETSPRASTVPAFAAAGAGAAAMGVGLGVGLGLASAGAPSNEQRQREPEPEANRLSVSSFSSNKSNRAPPPAPVTIPVAARVPGVIAGSDSPAPSSAASSIRSGNKGHKKSNSISRKAVPPVDPDLLSSPELLTRPPARQSSLRKVLEGKASGSPKLTSSPSMEGTTELLTAPSEVRPGTNGLIEPPPRDSSRISPRLPPSPAFGTPPMAAPTFDVDGGMPQPPLPSSTPPPRSASASSSPLVRDASVKGSPRILERVRSLGKAKKLGGSEPRAVVTPSEGRNVRGVDLSAVGHDVIGTAPVGTAAAAAAVGLASAPTLRPQTPPNQVRGLHDAASPRSILSSPHSGDGHDLDAPPVSLSSAQVVTATPANARVVSLHNGQITNVTFDPQSGTPAGDKVRPMSSPASPSRIPRRPSGNAHSKSASASAATSDSGHAPVPRGLGFGFLSGREDGVERITVEDSVPGDHSPKALTTPSPSNVNAVNLNSAGNTPVADAAAIMPQVTSTSPSKRNRDLSSQPGASQQPASHLTPPTGVAATVATTPQSKRQRHSSQSSKFRLPFRSPRPPEETESDLSPPLSPTSARLRTQSITNAFRLRRNTNTNTPPGSPPVRNSVQSSTSTSDDHSTLPYEYGLQGLGLGSFALAPSAYRTPGGGIGYTPPKMERKLSVSAQEAFASAREKQAAEQAETLAAFRKSEKARANSSYSSANPHSRVTSMAMSEFMSDDSHYDVASDEVPQSLSLAMVHTAGSEPVASPVEQLAAAASAARLHRQAARDSPSSPTAGDEGAEERHGAREAALSSSGDRDEFHDAVSDLTSERSERGYHHGESIVAARAAQEEREEAERACERAAAAEDARREAAREAELAAEARRLEKERLRLEAARIDEERITSGRRAEEERKAAEEARLADARRAEEAQRAEEERKAEAERRAEEERRVEEERVAEAERRSEERRAEERNLEEEKRVEEMRQAEEHRLAEMERRFEADRAERVRAEEEERMLAAQREAERADAERLESERLSAERAAHEEATRAAAAAEGERRAREQKGRDEVKRQLEGGKADGGVMLRGWVTVQTMSSPTWRRRYFHLLSSELRLFKSDSDARPLTTVTLSGARVSEAYEESAVQGSWKLEAGGKEFYMFADSADDRATVLQGLSIAIGK